MERKNKITHHEIKTGLSINFIGITIFHFVANQTSL